MQRNILPITFSDDEQNDGEANNNLEMGFPTHHPHASPRVVEDAKDAKEEGEPLFSLQDRLNQLSAAEGGLADILNRPNKKGQRFATSSLISLFIFSLAMYFYCRTDRTDLPVRIPLSLLMMMSIGTFIAFAGASCGYYCDADQRGARANAMRAHPNFNASREAALVTLRENNIEVKNTENPDVLATALQTEKQKILTEKNNRIAQRLAFLSGSNRRLGQCSKLRQTFFNNLDGSQRGSTQNGICETIFELAGMKL